jgi:predicted dehydrogenase/threonine dehydrogenase-like Zn-dependent dehydrogenase
MKQVLRKGLKEIVVDEVPDPVVAPHHVLIRPSRSLISSGTETASIHAEGVVRGVAENPGHLRKVWDAVKVAGPLGTYSEISAKMKTEYGVMGYSGAGVLVEKHPTVTDLEVGARVAYGGEGTGHAETVLAGRYLVARVPDEVSFEEACFTTVGSIALHSVRVAKLGVGDVVAVIGLGLVGQLVAQLARCQGAVVIALDIRGDRIELARKLGADHGVAVGDEAERQVATLTEGRGVDCAIVAAASKSAAPCELAIRLCRDRGKMVVVGAVDMSLSRDMLYAKEIDVLMSRAYGPGSYDASYERGGKDYPISYVRWTENRNMEEFLRLVATGRVNVREMITHRFALADAPEAYDTIMDPSRNSLAVVLTYPDFATDAATSVAFRPHRKVAIPGAAASKDRLRFALVGAGNLAKWAHLPSLRKLPSAQLHAVYSASGARGKSYAMRFGATYACSEYQQILDDRDIDVVLIASRNREHADQAEAALRAGKHVFLEKPMALTLDECRRLTRAVEETGRQLTVGFNRRFAPFYAEQQRLLARRSGPAVINCRVNSPGLSGAYWAAEAAHGGAILGEGCHFVDLMFWMLGSEPVWVSASSLPRETPDPIGEHNIAASIGFADGSIAAFTYCTVGSKTSAGERIETFVPGLGSVVEDFKWLQVRGATRRTKSQWWPEKGYGDQLDSFVRSLREGSAPKVTVRDGARATIVCLGLLESARDRTPRTIDLDAALGDVQPVRPPPRPRLAEVG